MTSPATTLRLRTAHRATTGMYVVYLVLLLLFFDLPSDQVDLFSTVLPVPGFSGLVRIVTAGAGIILVNGILRMTLQGRNPKTHRRRLWVAILVTAAVLLILGLLSLAQLPDRDTSTYGAILFGPVLFLLTGLSTAIIGGGLLLRRDRETGVQLCRRVAMAAMLATFAVPSEVVLWQHPLPALINIPSTGIALWSIYFMQRYRRMPIWILLLASGWGLLVASGYALATEPWLLSRIMSGLLHSPGLVTSGAHLQTTVALIAGVIEEGAKAVGVAVIVVLFRHHIDGIVSGIVVGAAVGLGFNFSESVGFMGSGNADDAAYQYLLRQSLGLFASHVAFTAIIGAGFGAARQYAQRRPRIVVITSGLVAAISGHFAADAILPHLAPLLSRWTGAGSWLETFVALPLDVLLTSGPFLLLYIVLLRHGLRNQASALAVELNAEAQRRSGAVDYSDVRLVPDPAARLARTIAALRARGITAARLVRREHATLSNLGMARWHHARGETDSLDLNPDTYRVRAIAMKTSLKELPS